MENEYIETLKQRNSYFEEYLLNAKRCFSEQRIDDCLIYLDIASRFIAENYTGNFYSSELENLAKSVSRHIFSRESNIKKDIYSGEERKVLHIATKIYEVGGHTRLLLNWINGDSLSENHILVTNLPYKNYPHSLLKTYDKAFRIINTSAFQGVNRIRKIREIASKYSYLVLHIHPEDIYTFMALVDINIPILFLNHADHRFWVGRDIVNLFLEIRDEGIKLSNVKRAIPQSHQELFPIPLKKPIIRTKQQARESLNIRNEKKIILSIASAYKYKPTNDCGLSEVVIGVANNFKNVEFIFIGPSAKEEYWNKIIEKSNGKVRVLGTIEEVDNYYLAADIYLDSYPVSSLTSLLDAAKYGVPLVSIQKNSGILDIDDIALDDNFKVQSLLELETKLLHILNNSHELFRMSNSYKKRVIENHLIEHNQSLIEQIFSRAKKNSLLDPNETVLFSLSELDRRLIYMYSNEQNVLFKYIQMWNTYYSSFSQEEKKFFLDYVKDKYNLEESVYKELLNEV